MASKCNPNLVCDYEFSDQTKYKDIGAPRSNSIPIAYGVKNPKYEEREGSARSPDVRDVA